jgi:hypothetical protein
VGKLKGKRPMGIHSRRWEDNIRMYIQDVGCRGTDWIDLAQDMDMWRAFEKVMMIILVS